MKPLLLFLGLLLLANCGQDAKSPVQPEGPATADSTRIAAFPDSGLEAAVREALKKPSGPLTSQDLLSLTQLVARSRGIADLAGIDTLQSLTALNLADNQITDLSPLSGLTRLRLLDLEDNQVADLSPLAGLAQLESLVLSGNRISDISPLLGLKGLRNLELGRNPLGQAGLGQQVWALQVRGVQVVMDQELSPSSLVVFADPRLEKVVRRAVKKTDPGIPLSREELLTTTSLNAAGLGNSAKSLDLAGIEQLANLVSLNLEGNKISDVSPLASLVHLKQLYLGHNQIYYLAPLSGLTQLEILALRSNQISDLSPLASLVHLKELDLANNYIQDIAALMHLPELVLVNLTGNPLNEEARDVHIPALRYSGQVTVIF